MKLKTLTTGLIVGLSVSCSAANQSNKVQPTPVPTESTPAYPITTPATSPSTIAVATSAQLTPEQVKQLQEITSLSSLEEDVIVPTYIPTEFKPFIFKNMRDSYAIIYQNSSNACFSIEVPITIDASAEELGNIVEINSPALGKVNLEYTNFVKNSNENLLGFLLMAKSPDDHSLYPYLFRSPPEVSFIPDKNQAQFKDCSPISLSEAVKVAESLQFLYHNDSRNIHFVPRI
jgi:hypothetical protein